MKTTMRNGKSVTTVFLDGPRSFRDAPIQDFASINLAKKENGLNATTGKFPPSIAEIHEAALEEDKSR